MADEKRAKRFRSATLGRNNPLLPELIEERKNALYEKQATDYADWISSYLKIEPFKTDLLHNLRSGQILLQLLQKIDPSKFGDLKFPTNQGSKEDTPQIYQNLSIFLTSCNQLGITEENLFAPDELLLEENKLQVLRTLQCLRLMSEGNFVVPETSSKKENPTILTSTPTKSTKSETIPPIPKSSPTSPNNVNPRVDEYTRRRSIRLFDNPTHQIGFNGERRPIKREEEDEDDEDDDEEDYEQTFEINPEFVEQLTPDIMAHLLSRHVTHDGEEDYEDEDYDSEGLYDDEDEEDTEEDDEEIQSHFAVQESVVIDKQDELIKTLIADNNRLQEIIETKIVFHAKETDQAQEREDALNEKIRELEERVEISEKRIKEGESKINELKELLSTKENTLTLISFLAKEREDALLEANNKISDLLHKLSIGKSESTMESLYKLPEDEHEQGQTQNQEQEQEQNQEATQPEKQEKQEQQEQSKQEHEEEHEQIGELKVRQVDPKERKHSILRKLTKKKNSTPITGIELIKALDKQKEARKIIQTESTFTRHRLWKQHPDAIPLLESLTSVEIEKQEMIYELIGTETSYNQDLHLVSRKFVEPLREKIGIQKFNQSDFESIFRNIENISRVSGAFLADLQERSSQQWPVIKKIGDVVIKHAPFFDVYTDYCGDQQRSVTEMKRAENDCPQIKELLQNALQDQECRKLDIYAFLLLPMQRVTKYPLLLKGLLKKTDPQDQDYGYLKAALSEIDIIIKSINEHTRRRDEIARLLEIGNQLDCSLIKIPINLSNSDEKKRTIYREGLLTRLRLKTHRPNQEKKGQGRKLEKLYIFFFSDLIVISKVLRPTPEAPPRYLVQVKPLKFSEVSIRNVPNASNGIGAKNVFLFSSQATGTLVLQASSEEEKNSWLDDFRKEDLIVQSLLKTEPTSGGVDKITLDEQPQSLPSPTKEKENVNTNQLSAIPKNLQVEEEVRRRSLTLPLKGSRPNSVASVSSIEGEEKRSRLQSWLQGTKKPEQFIEITVQQLSDPEFDGYLKVLSKGAFPRATWKWRYCLLKEFTLYFFLNEKPESRGTLIIHLTGYTITAKKGKKNIFELRHPTNPSDVLILSAETEEYMRVWIEALTHATLARTAPKRTFWL